MKKEDHMNELQLIKSERFGEIEADIYSNGDYMYMTINQLAACLGYADRSGVQKLVDRNDYLNAPEFSGWDNLSLPQGGKQKTRVFTEDGIYEVTMLSGQPKAKEFRAWIRGILKALRIGAARLSITAYPTKATSAGEVAQLIKQLRATMKDNDQPPEVIAQMVKSVCDQFGIVLPPNFVKVNPFEQFALIGMFWPGQGQLPVQ